MPGAHHSYFEVLETTLCNNIKVSYFQANCTMGPFLQHFQKQPDLLRHDHAFTAGVVKGTIPRSAKKYGLLLLIFIYTVIPLFSEHLFDECINYVKCNISIFQLETFLR